MISPIFKRWAQDQYLKDNWERAPIDRIAAVIGRAEDAIKQREYKLMGTTLDSAPIGRNRK